MAHRHCGVPEPPRPGPSIVRLGGYALPRHALSIQQPHVSQAGLLIRAGPLIRVGQAADHQHAATQGHGCMAQPGRWPRAQRYVLEPLPCLNIKHLHNAMRTPRQAGSGITLFNANKYTACEDCKSIIRQNQAGPR